MNQQDNFEHNANNSIKNGGRSAVVIGGSLAGLLTARILADHFDRVTVIERDRYPEQPVSRKGVPQARHLHAMLMRGLLIIEELFPGIRDELIEAGAPVIDTSADLAWLTPGGWGKRFNSDLIALSFSRGLLDWTVRRRMEAVEQVRFLEDCEVSGLVPNSAGTEIKGVCLRFRNKPDSSAQALLADLVVDASGRSSRAPEWLKTIGYDAPQETVVNPHLGYASRIYERPAGFQADWKSAFVQAAPPNHNRAGILFLIEGNRWMLTISGRGGDYPPTDEEGFTKFVRSLRSSVIYEAIKDAKPLTPIYGYRATENRLRHYEKLSRLPERFVLVGDSVCAFNPVYGQGMSVAAMGAMALDQALREQQQRVSDGLLAGLAKRFQKHLSKVVALPWMLATGEDCRYPNTEGASPDWKLKLMHKYMDSLLSLTTTNKDVRRRWLEVFHMLKPPAALFHPSILFRVLAQAVKPTLASRKPPSQKNDVAEATLS
ncbi:MAG TPA: 2-polyprenyl-6-methoxyphenol hydroxylase-like oxidoreductase [Blastocatellia bacterium]|nr:2-polyprenyl-6-methoxyphenol hydroxylase-like oxidoreductase [Blastocatellia bacterium]